MAPEEVWEEDLQALASYLFVTDAEQLKSVSWPHRIPLYCEALERVRTAAKEARTPGVFLFVTRMRSWVTKIFSCPQLETPTPFFVSVLV